MKHAFRLILVVAALMCSMTLSAQKYGYINTQELIAAMPERDSVQLKLAAYGKELGETLETIQVEFNNKFQEYQKGLTTTSEAVRQLKEKELQDLQTRYEEFQQSAQQDMQKMQSQLMTPVVDRAEDAIKNVCKASGLDAVFDTSTGTLAYFNESSLVNVLPLVKKKLGIKE